MNAQDKAVLLNEATKRDNFNNTSFYSDTLNALDKQAALAPTEHVEAPALGKGINEHEI